VATLTAEAIAHHAAGAGFKSEALTIAVAVALAESKGATDAEGDVGIQTAVWGPSLGLWQVRSVKAESGKGTSRDATRLTDPAFNARSAYSISSGGTRFGPWSVYTSGAYRMHLTKAAAAGQGAGSAGGVSGGVPSAPASLVQGGTGGGIASAPGSAPDSTPDLGVTPVVEVAGDFVVPREVTAILLDDAVGKTVQIAKRIVGLGRFELSASKSGQLEILVADPNRELPRAGVLRVRGTGFWGAAKNSPAKFPFEIAAYSMEPVAANPMWKLQLRSAGTQRLKHDAGPGAMKDVSPTEWANRAGVLAGLTLVGQGSPKRPDIAPTKDGDVVETPLEVLKRLAEEEGFWTFEAGFMLYFAKPSWLVDKLPTVTVTVETGRPRTDCVGLPLVRRSVDSEDGEVIEISLPRGRGEQVRPGMALVMRWPAWLPGFVERYLVTDVSWPLDGGREPVSITAMEPTDPPLPKSAASVDPGDPATAGAITIIETRTNIGTAGAPVYASEGSVSKEGFSWPSDGFVTSVFGAARPAAGGGTRKHAGIDIGVPIGAPIRASHAGVVQYAEWQQGYGYVVYVKREDGTTSRYAHLSKFSVNPGKQVSQGQLIAYSGNSGVSSGPHLHFEIWPGGRAPADPLTLLPRR